MSNAQGQSDRIFKAECTPIKSGSFITNSQSEISNAKEKHTSNTFKSC